MCLFLRVAAALWCAFAALLPAEAQNEGRRVALVIGNAQYKMADTLDNPGRDAAAMAEVLARQLKFDKVILRQNLGLDGFRAALREMAREAAGADIGVVFYAGHGIEVGGRNYLIPADATIAAAGDIELEAVALDTVLSQLEGVRKLKLVILDACRNNPFAAAGGKRSVSRGLARIEPEGGTLVAYAAKEGTTADDGTAGVHSPFTTALLKRIVMPGIDVRLLFGFVADDVLAATNRVQRPVIYGDLGGEPVYLSAYGTLLPPAMLPSASGAAPMAAAPPPQPPEWELRAPIDNLFAAWKSLDFSLYINQWADEGIQYHHKSGTKLTRAELYTSRRRDFAQAYASVSPQYEARLREFKGGTAIFDVKYTLTMTTLSSGRTTTDRGCESYQVAQRNGRWLIIRNDDYVASWALCLK